MKVWKSGQVRTKILKFEFWLLLKYFFEKLIKFCNGIFWNNYIHSHSCKNKNQFNKLVQ